MIFIGMAHVHSPSSKTTAISTGRHPRRRQIWLPHWRQQSLGLSSVHKSMFGTEDEVVFLLDQHTVKIPLDEVCIRAVKPVYGDASLVMIVGEFSG
ncbi:hypothetical protein BC938DRAFT_473618, partial [Jimgerdemannia flammicorona]